MVGFGACARLDWAGPAGGNEAEGGDRGKQEASDEDTQATNRVRPEILGPRLDLLLCGDPL